MQSSGKMEDEMWIHRQLERAFEKKKIEKKNAPTAAAAAATARRATTGAAATTRAEVVACFVFFVLISISTRDVRMRRFHSVRKKPSREVVETGEKAEAPNLHRRRRG